MKMRIHVGTEEFGLPRLRRPERLWTVSGSMTSDNPCLTHDSDIPNIPVRMASDNLFLTYYGILRRHSYTSIPLIITCQRDSEAMINGWAESVAFEEIIYLRNHPRL